MNTTSEKNPAPSGVSQTRFVIGAILFIGGFASPLLIPWVLNSELSTSWKTFLSAGLTAGLPEIGMLAAVAVLGKQGFTELKSRLFALVRKHTEASAVSPARYRLGLVMFTVPLLAGFTHPYLAHFFPAIGFPSLLPVVVLDLVFATSLLVLGAGFWDKVRALFQAD